MTRSTPTCNRRESLVGTITKAADWYESHTTSLTTAADAVIRSRTDQGLHQTDVASLAGVRQTDVSVVERGKGNPTTRTLFAITTALQTHMHIVAEQQSRFVVCHPLHY